MRSLDPRLSFSRSLAALSVLGLAAAAAASSPSAFAQALTPQKPSPSPVPLVKGKKTAAAATAKKGAKSAAVKSAKATRAAAKTTTAATPPALPTSLYGYPLGKVAVTLPPEYALFNQGLAAFQAHHYPEAERFLRKGVALAPRDNKGWGLLGYTLAHESKYDEAIAALRKAAQYAPHPAEAIPAWDELTRLYGLRHQWPECAEAAQKALAPVTDKADPAAAVVTDRDPDAMTAFAGLALSNEGKFADALPYLRKRKPLPGETGTGPDVRLVFALRQTGAAREALEALQPVADAHPKDAGLQLMLADTENAVGDKAAAAKAFTRAYELDPTNRTAAMNASIAAMMQGDREKALGILRGLAARYPDEARVHFYLGELLYDAPAGPKQRQEWAEAAKELNAAAVRDPKNAVYVAQAGLALVLQGPERNKEAANYLRSALTLDPELPMAHLGLGYIAESEHDLQGATEQYKTLIAGNKDPNSTALARRHLAGLLYASGKKEEAYQQWEALISGYAVNDPRGTTELAQLASRLLGDQKYPEAANAYTRLAQRSPGDPQAYLGLGKSLEGEKKPDEAAAQYRKALEVDPGNDTAALILYNLMKGQGKEADAEALLEKTIAADPKREHNFVRTQLAYDYEAKGRIDDALDQLGKMVQRRDDPNRAQNLVARAEMMLRHGRAGAAVAELTALSNENRDVPLIRFALADAQEQAGHTDAAIKTLTALIDGRGPGSGPANVGIGENPGTAVVQSAADAEETVRNAHLQLAQLLEKHSRLDEAAAQYEAILDHSPGDNVALADLTRIRATQKKPEAVGAFLEDMVLLNPAPTPDSRRVDLVNRAYRDSKQPEKWSAFTKKLAAQYPHHLPILILRLSALLPSDPAVTLSPADQSEADALVTHVLQIDPNDPQAHWFLGRLREAQGRTSDAITAYTESARLAKTEGDAATALRRLHAPVPPPNSAAAAAAAVSTAPPASKPATHAATVPAAAPASPATANPAPKKTIPADAAPGLPPTLGATGAEGVRP